jgi:uncharacterized membrane protein
MASIAETGETMSVGNVFSRGFGVIVDNPATVFGIAFIFGALPSVALSWFQQHMLGFARDEYTVQGSLAVMLAVLLINLAIQAFVQGCLVRATLAYTRGERATFAESAGASVAVLLPLIALAIVIGISVIFGLMFIFVPGVILYVMWSVASPALVAERTGVFGALGRSRFLTKGARWKVFGIELILVIAYYIFLATLGAVTLSVTGANLTSAIASSNFLVGWIVVSVIASTIINTVWSTVQTSLYVELRNWKEGLPEESLAEIFA